MLKVAYSTYSAALVDLPQRLGELCPLLNQAVSRRAYRITVRRMHSQQAKDTLIRGLAACIEGEVDLKEYEVDVTVYNVGGRLYFVFNALTDEFVSERARFTSGPGDQSLDRSDELTRAS